MASAFTPPPPPPPPSSLHPVVLRRSSLPARLRARPAARRGRVAVRERRKRCEQRQHAAPTSLIPPPPRPPPPRSPDEDDGGGDGETALSRRVFLLGTAFSTAVTAVASYRFFVGDDEQARVRRRLAAAFPALFPPPPSTSTPPRPFPVDGAFAAAYFAAFAAAAARTGVLDGARLRDEEAAVRARAARLFFADSGDAAQAAAGGGGSGGSGGGVVAAQQQGRTWKKAEEEEVAFFSDASRLNFALYARLHALSGHTSPATRRQLSDLAARAVLPSLGWGGGGGASASASGARVPGAGDAAGWRAAVAGVMEGLVRRGWVAAWRLEQFDAAEGSSWADERRMSFTLFALNPVTMQAAQLLGEEQFEELSPKVSAFVNAVLVDVGLTVSFEDYYLDDVYRPDPEEFRPTQLATQFDVSLQ